MATETLPAQGEAATPAAEIHTLAWELQDRCSRVRSLAEAILDDADKACSEEQIFVRQRLINNAINFANLIEAEVGAITDMGERIEMLSKSVGGVQ